MKVSVAMATFNGQEYINEQLESIINQTRNVDEVIIADDQSKDTTVPIIEEFILKNNLQDKWKLIQNEKNMGYADNFNMAALATTGDIIVFCDQDDIWVPDRIECMVNTMEKYPEIMMLGTEFEPYYCTSDAPEINRKVLKQFTNTNEIEHIVLNGRNIFIGSEGCTMCVRSLFYREIQNYRFPGWAHDEFVWKLSQCKDGCYILHKVTLKRRLHSNNVSKKKMHAKEQRIIFLKKLLKSHEAMLDYAQYSNIDSNDIRLIKRNIQATNIRLKMLNSGKLVLFFQLLFKYLDCFQYKRAIITEVILSIKRK